MRKRNAREAKRLCYSHSWSSLSWDLTVLPWALRPAFFPLSCVASLMDASQRTSWWIGPYIFYNGRFKIFSSASCSVMRYILYKNIIPYYEFIFILFLDSRKLKGWVATPPRESQMYRRHCSSQDKGRLLRAGECGWSNICRCPFTVSPRALRPFWQRPHPPSPAHPQINRDLDCQKHS